MAKNEEIKEKENQMLNMVESFCNEHLNEEYAELSMNLVKKMGRKHDVPFKRGKLEIWASATIYAIAQINFLFDKSFKPYVTADDICDYFKTKKSTVGDKARTIRNMFNMDYYDNEFSTELMKNNNPYEKLAITDEGFIVPKNMLNEEEEYANILELMADEADLSEDEMIEKIFKELVEEKGEKLTTEEIREIKSFLLNPIPINNIGEFLTKMNEALDELELNDNDDIDNEGIDIEDINIGDVDFFDDYVIDESNPMETIEDYEKAIKLFETTKGKEYFKENKGYFWSMAETRPYMTNLLDHAMMLWNEGKIEKAVEQLSYILELNPEDNQGVRYILINLLIKLNKIKDCEELIDFFDEEYSAVWTYSKLLLNIKQNKDATDTKQLYNEAIETNKHVVDYLIGEKKLPKDPPAFYSPGDENEALHYLHFAYNLWTQDETIMNTLKELSKKENKN
jgi:tetratricopeptide (TPR) repeat protein